jgi:ribose/xylose/arabinose/galactoside ABC-type transport system permease subunit
MKKIFGILGLLVFVCLVTGLLNPERFLSEYNIGNLVRRSSLFAIFSIGVAFVIITGGIDLSIGSVVALVGCLLPWLLMHEKWPVSKAIVVVITISLAIGLFHGLLITKLRLQPFVVTLCGLLLYRGIARGITRDQTQGFGNLFKDLNFLASGKPFAMTWLIAAVGVVLIVWALMPQRQQRERAIPRMVMAIVGSIIALIGTAPLWWRLTPDTTSIDPDVFAQMSFWRRGIIELGAAEADQVPALLLYWLGLLSCAAGFLWFAILSLRDARRTGPPLAAAVISSIIGFFICRGAVRAWPEAVDAMLQLPKMWVVLRLAAGLAIAGGGLIWFASNSLRATGPSLRAPLFLGIAGGVMCLLGFTPLPQLLVPMPMLIMLGLGILAAITLNNTIWGRYLLALGRNEQAARYSGINTHSMIILAYVICSLLAGLGGMLFVLDVNSAQPADFGNFYELYAIAAAVLGGCSLRGGEGTIAGVIIGAAVMQILKNSINLLEFPTQIEYAIIGAVLLIGVTADELTKRVAARRRAIT